MEHFGWDEYDNPERLMAKLRTAEVNPLPYVHIGRKYFYIEEQVVDWLNVVQSTNLPRERAILEAARRAR